MMVFMLVNGKDPKETVFSFLLSWKHQFHENKKVILIKRNAIKCIWKVLIFFSRFVYPLFVCLHALKRQKKCLFFFLLSLNIITFTHARTTRIHPYTWTDTHPCIHVKKLRLLCDTQTHMHQKKIFFLLQIWQMSWRKIK